MITKTSNPELAPLAGMLLGPPKCSIVATVTPPPAESNSQEPIAELPRAQEPAAEDEKAP